MQLYEYTGKCSSGTYKSFRVPLGSLCVVGPATFILGWQASTNDEPPRAAVLCGARPTGRAARRCSGAGDEYFRALCCGQVCAQCQRQRTRVRNVSRGYVPAVRRSARVLKVPHGQVVLGPPRVLHNISAAPMLQGRGAARCGGQTELPQVLAWSVFQHRHTLRRLPGQHVLSCTWSRALSRMPRGKVRIRTAHTL